MIDLIKKLSAEPRTPMSVFTKECIDFLSNELGLFGYEASIFSSSLQEWRATSAPSLELFYNDDTSKKVIPLISATYSPSTPSTGVKGKLIVFEKISMLDSFAWDSYAVLDEDSQPIGLIICTDYGSMSQPLPNNKSDLPTAIIPSKYIEEINTFVNSERTSTVNLHVPTESFGESNVPSLIASHSDTVGPTPLVCAHIDTIHNSPGAHDNASGIAVALELAKFCAKNKIVCNFAFFNCEESNKVASTNYVQQFKPSELLGKYNLVIEIDSVGIGNQISLLCTKKLRKKLRNLEWGFELYPGFEIDVNPQSKICFSDVWPFMQHGVPVIRMLSRDTVNRLDQEVMHTKNDTPEKLNEITLSFALNTAKVILQSEIYKN